MKPIVALCIVCLMVLAAPASAVDCKEWNSREFLKTATVTDVAGCLQSSADPNVQDKTGMTPLHWAARANQNPKVITALVEAGADLNVPNDVGSRPLHWAAGVQ